MSSQRYISDSLKRKKKKVRRIRRLLFLLAIVLALAGVVYLLRLPPIQISEVRIEGNAFVTTAEIQAKADEVLNSNILFVIPKRNILLLSKGEIAGRIRQNPAVTDVVIRKDFPSALEIRITEQEKQALYCTTAERSDCFYINGQGYIYSPVHEYVDPQKEIIIYAEGDPKGVRDFVLEQELYGSVMGFIRASARYGLDVRSVLAKADGVLEFRTGAGTALLVSRFDDLEADFANLVALFEKGVLAKDQLGGVEYVDLRFGNRVFYKARSGHAAQPVVQEGEVAQ